VCGKLKASGRFLGVWANHQSSVRPCLPDDHDLWQSYLMIRNHTAKIELGNFSNGWQLRWQAAHTKLWW